MLSSDISIIVQGPIVPETKTLISTLKAILPFSEIIVSTWETNEPIHLGKDVSWYAISKDPGPQMTEGFPIPNNINRQIISTREGLKVATKQYAMKIRSDMLISSANFMNLYWALAPKNPKHKVFKQHILCNNLSSRNPWYCAGSLLYHPADHFQFGLTADLLTLWDIPLQSTEDASYFKDKSLPDLLRQDEASRLTPEQHLCTQALGKFKKVNLPHYAYTDWKELRNSERLLHDNFIFIKDSRLGLEFHKYKGKAVERYAFMRRNSLNSFSVCASIKGLVLLKLKNLKRTLAKKR